MAFDWKKLDQEEKERDSRLTLALGISYAALAVTATVVMLVTHSTKMLGALLVWVFFGVILLGVSVSRRRRR